MRNLIEVLNKEYLYGKSGENILKIAKSGIKIIDEYSCFRGDRNYKPWIGTQKNVTFWYLLENWKAIWFNENIKSGFNYVLGNTKKQK